MKKAVNINKKIRIAYVIDQLNIGGAEKQLLEIVRGLDKSKYSIYVCSIWPHMALLEEFKQTNANIVAIHKKHRWDISVIFKLACFLKRQKVDIVHTILPTANMWGRSAALFSRAKAIIASERALRYGNENKWWHNISDRLLGPFTDVMLTNSKIGAEWWRAITKLPKSKFRTVYNGVDLTTFNQSLSEDEKDSMKRSLGLNRASKIVGTIGRLSPEKGHLTLIYAAKIIAKSNSKVKFAIIGNGGLREYLKKEVEDNGMAHLFHFLGERPEIPELLSLFDVFVLPSEWEGFPNVILEAMAMKKPIVSSNVGGVNEAVINGKTGLLVPPNDPEAMAKATLTLLENQKMAKEIGQAARKCVEENFSMDRMVKQTEQLYDELILIKER